MNNSTSKIAVVGMACRFPDADNVDEYWKNLILGKESLTHFTDEEIEKNDPYFKRFKNNPDYVKVRGVLKDVDKFDAAFFGMTPREASETDPQQRLWFETAWTALENAGCDPSNYHGAIGVFAGGSMSSYLFNNILRDPKRMESYFRPDFGATAQLMIANDISYIPTKTAYFFNLKGPAVYVQTACSTSLVAIIQACQSLYSYDSDVCLAGGVKISLPQVKGYLYQEGAIASPDGRCRPFDEKANGTVGGNGVGVVVLKRMEDAIRDNDTIYALVSGWALNNDGSNKVSFAAPSIDGQAEVIMMAQSFAEVSPEEISYVETHGTATKLGDPIEMAGLTKAFSAKTNKKQFCGIGSVKSNIGHTDAAAGVASFIKVCLSAYYKKIPPSLHYTSPNPHIDFKNSPFYVLNHVKEWTDEKPLIMGVSSFGIGGTNAHVIVEQPPKPEKAGEAKSEWPELIVLSAKTEDSLKQQKQNLAEFLNTRADLNIHDVANTLAYGRNHMSYRSFMVASAIDEIVSGEKAFTDGKKDNQVSKIAFMFPGQGAQYARMGKDLYQKNKTFRDILDECFMIFKAETGEDLMTILFADDTEESDRRLAGTELTQPSLFIIEYALAKVLEQLDVRPDYLIGHSIGEYAAACLSGVFDLPAALKIVIKRSQLMSKMPSGKMMAVRKDIEKLKSISGSNFEIAADNASEACTISFKTEDTEKVKALLDENNIECIPLNTSHAFHSATFDPILSEFRDYVNQFNLKNPELPFISCLTGNYITNEQATSGAYWAQQLRNTVSFRQGISKIAENEGIIFLEVGPNTHLSSLVRQAKEIVNKKLIINTLGKSDNSDEQYKILAALGNMYNAGFSINFEILSHNISHRKIALPAYPFEKRRHWIDFDFSALTAGDDSSVKSTDKEALDAVDGIYRKTDIGKTDQPEGINDRIAGIWESLLGNDDIGLDDDFYEIGGHSLLALQILTRMKEELGIKITLKEFLDNPTINKLNAQFGFEGPKPEQRNTIAQTVDISNFPLSYSQKRIWIISKLDVINPAYNIPFSFKITGGLNIDLFNNAINILFNRHFTMFSLFKEKDGNPYCEIVPKPIKVELLDYSGKPAEQSENEILSFIGSDTRKQFDLERGPLFRIYLSKQSDTRCFFHGTIHHIIFDGWSFSVFVNDLKKIYDSLASSSELVLEDVKGYYLDYARGLLTAGQDNANLASEKFWVNTLSGCSPKLDFPYDFPRKDVTTGFGEKEKIQLPVECTARLKEVARKAHATPFATLLSLMGVLYQRYSGENDICIGTHVANRSSSGLEKIFGMFVNTIPVRLKIDETQTISSFIDDTKNILLESIAHQEVPFERIVEVVNPERYSNVNPIFQVAVQWISYSAKPLKFVDFEAELVNVKEGISPFDISFNLWEHDGQIKGEVEYNIDILKRDTILRLIDNFIRLVESAVENPDKKISEVSVISDNDKKKLDGFNDTKVAVSDCLIHNLFENQISKKTQATAVISGESALTYEALNNKANQLAGHLVSLGVTPGDIVGIYIERSIEMVVSVLGVLKAGGCYLPLDPSFPEERLRYMLEDSEARVIVSQSSLREKARGFAISSLVMIDDDKEKIESNPVTIPDVDITPDSPAYIIYTSGSTGRPKGVPVRHQAVVNLIESMAKVPGISDKDRLLAVVTLSFDMSVYELFLTLSNGATMVIANSQDVTDGLTLAELIKRHDITIIQATPSFWHILLSTGWKGKNNLKALCGGEALTPSLIRQILPKVGEFWNCYGPTEITVYATCARVMNADDRIHIGKPINNTRIYILDKNNNPLPLGVTGEVAIGGTGVSKGYRNRPELTEEKFVRYGDGEIIYKTGDLGRLLEDGNIELFGRADNQIKLRGFRIEPGEIESLLTKLPHVAEAVVKIHRFEDNDERLVAFLNVGNDYALTNEKVMDALTEKLPSYMIPSFIQAANGFPRLPNGKINKNALVLEIDMSKQNAAIDFDLLTETQKKMIVIWQDILKVNAIDTSDSFFNLGGNSLLAISLLNKIKEQTGFELSFKDVITHPTIALISGFIDNNATKSEESISLVHLTDTTNLPLTANQKRIWMITKLQPDIPSYIIPLTYKLSGPLNTEVFEKSINLLFQRHYVLFSVIQEKAGEPYCNLVPSEVKVDLIDYTGFDEKTKERNILEYIDHESVRVFDLENGPLYRVSLLKTGKEEYFFHMTIHHIVFDGWSIKVLISDLNKIYNGLLNRTGISLENLEFQQYDFAWWEGQPQRKISEEKAVEFWENYLKDVVPVLNFPYDNLRKAQPSGLGGREKFSLNQELSKKLLHLCEKENISLFGTMLSSYAILLQKYTGENDICIGTPVAYRPHSKLEDIIGMFVNTIVIRTKVEGDRTFRENIHSTNESLLNALAYRQMPFEKVVDIVKPERSSNTNPIFQTIFAWQDNLGTPLQLEGVTSSPVDGRNGTSVFDLGLYMWESGKCIEGEIEFNTDLLQRETIVRLRDNYITLLNNLADNYDVSNIDSLSILSESELLKIRDFAGIKTEYPKDKTIVQLFEEQVMLFPKKTSLVFNGKSLTYDELNRKANQLARTLIENGIDKNTPVAILAEKSIDIIVGILGILKSGGAYVPIDPDYPEQRVRFILNDSGCKVLVTQEKFMTINIDGVKKINLNSTDSFTKMDSDPGVTTSPDDLAYIMYTSGTTGNPKGSMIIHRAVVRLIRNTNYVDLTHEDRILLTGAFVFDATTFEIWGALLNGGTIYLVEKAIILNPKALGIELKDNNITVLWLTSPLFTQIAETHTDIFSKLKYLLVGGDVLSAPHINKVRRDNPSLKIINGYGPTENTTFSTTFLIDKDYENNIPIGKPISNSTAYIFNKSHDFQPIGVIGELLVGGDGLSKGYLNREDLNLKSFIENPHKPGERLYLTGDLAKWLPDGNIEFHGRADNQLKIRGFRVELEEIESVISEIDGVIETVIKPIKIQEGDVRLVAFLNISDSYKTDVKELVIHLKGKLPPYMVPSGFKFLNGFPKNVNGKIDRKALVFDIKELSKNDREILKDFTHTEEKIYTIWCETLKTKDISLTDNFFDIGGNSLMAISLFSKIESAFNVELGLRVFFNSPRIKSLAEVIDLTLHKPETAEPAKETPSKSIIIKGEL